MFASHLAHACLRRVFGRTRVIAAKFDELEFLALELQQLGEKLLREQRLCKKRRQTKKRINAKNHRPICTDIQKKNQGDNGRQLFHALVSKNHAKKHTHAHAISNHLLCICCACCACCVCVCLVCVSPKYLIKAAGDRLGGREAKVAAAHGVVARQVHDQPVGLTRLHDCIVHDGGAPALGDAREQNGAAGQLGGVHRCDRDRGKEE